MELPYIPFRTFVSKTAPLRMSQKPLPPMPAKSQHRRASSVYSQCLPPHSAMTLPTSVADSLRITNALLETVEFSRSTSCLPEQHPVTPPLLEAKVYRPPNASSSSLSSHSDSEINFPLPAVYLEAGTYSPSLQVFSLSSANSSINENHLCEDEDQAAGSPPELLHAPLGTGKLCHASRGRSPTPRSPSQRLISEDEPTDLGSSNRTPRNRGRSQEKQIQIRRVSRSNSPLHGPRRTREHPPTPSHTPASNISPLSHNTTHTPFLKPAYTPTEASTAYHQILTERYRHERTLSPLPPPHPPSNPTSHRHRKTASTASDALSLYTKQSQLRPEPSAAQRVRAAIPIRIPSVRRRARPAAAATAQSAGSSPLARAASTERFSTFFQRPATLRSPRVDARSREGGDGLAALGPMEVVAAPLEPERRGARARSERRKGLYGKGLGIGVSVGSSIRALGQLGGEEVRAERRREEMKQRIRLVGTVDPSSVSFKVVDLPARD